MVLIGIWFNPFKNTFYSKTVRYVFLYDYYRVGYINQHNHQLVALFYLHDKKLYQCDSYWDIDFKKFKLKYRILDYIEKKIKKLKGE